MSIFLHPQLDDYFLEFLDVPSLVNFYYLNRHYRKIITLYLTRTPRINKILIYLCKNNYLKLTKLLYHTNIIQIREDYETYSILYRGFDNGDAIVYQKQLAIFINDHSIGNDEVYKLICCGDHLRFSQWVYSLFRLKIKPDIYKQIEDIFYYAISKSYLRVAKWLMYLDQNKYHRITDSAYTNAILTYCYDQNLPMIKEIHQCCDVSTRSLQSAYGKAFINGQMKIVQWLESIGIKMEPTINDVFYNACSLGNLDKIKELSLNVKYYCVGFRYAYLHGQLEVVQWLSQFVDMEDIYDGIETAYKNKNYQILEYLLSLVKK